MGFTMNAKFWSVGGATFAHSEPQRWTDFFLTSKMLCVSWPFVILKLNLNQVKICLPFRTYVIPRGEIELVRCQRWPSWGVRILHHHPNAPKYLVYSSFHNRGVLRMFRTFGYPV